MKNALVSLLLVGLAVPVMAACNPDNNGGTCNVDPGVGPQGPQGVQGPQGLSGTSGQDGKAGPARLDPRMNEAKLVIDTAVRLYDGKRVQLQIFNVYAFGTHPDEDIVGDGNNREWGVRFVFKLGKSYEETLLEKQAAQIKALESILGRLSQ